MVKSSTLHANKQHGRKQDESKQNGRDKPGHDADHLVLQLSQRVRAQRSFYSMRRTNAPRGLPGVFSRGLSRAPRRFSFGASN
jgi:hypothetical protein